MLKKFTARVATTCAIAATMIVLPAFGSSSKALASQERAGERRADDSNENRSRAKSKRGHGAEAERNAGERRAKRRAVAQRRRRARRLYKTRRGKPAGYAVPASMLRETPPDPPSGNLHLVNVASKESIKINIFDETGDYDIDALRSVTHLFRCKRTSDERDVNPRLLTILSHVYDHYGKPIELLSGYRNQTKTTSFHYKASASDIRVEGVAPRALRQFVDSLDSGGMGIGLYPRTGFVHVDVRPPPSYRWIDYSRSDPGSRDKRPPRNWKHKRRRKLES
jgi:uncharacterized protein YcbK (DUF882 family)